MVCDCMAFKVLKLLSCWGKEMHRGSGNPPASLAVCIVSWVRDVGRFHAGIEAWHKGWLQEQQGRVNKHCRLSYGARHATCSAKKDNYCYTLQASRPRGMHKQAQAHKTQQMILNPWQIITSVGRYFPSHVLLLGDV